MSNCASCNCAPCACSITVIPQAPIVISVQATTPYVTTPSPIVIGPGQGGAVGPQGLQGTQGLQGITAAQGTQGISGAVVSSSDAVPEGSNNLYFRTDRVAYVHTQGVPSDSWVIPHNLGFFPNLTVQDSSGTIYEGEITHTNSGSLTVSFSSAFSGTAYLS